LDILVKNATLITPWETLPAVSIGIRGEKIAAVYQGDPGISAGTVIDAKGKYVLPGLIDCHHHFGAFLPFEEDVLTETRAAAFGGVTTVFHVILEQDSIAERISYYIDTASRLSSVDMHFWAACMTKKHLSEIPECRKRGLKGFKFFMAYKGNEMEKVGIFGIDLSFLYEGMKIIKAAGGIALVHAENYEMLQYYKQQHSHENDFKAFCRSRPPLCEEIDAESACRLAAEAGVSLYIVHVGAGRVLDIAARYRRNGGTVYLETSPRYLVIDNEGSGLKHPEVALTTPAYKSKADIHRLWSGVKAGEFDCIASDSAANQLKVKMGKGSVWQTQLSWQEMPTLLPMMVTKGVHGNRMSLNQIVRLCSYNPANIFGIYPQKGSVSPGADADLIALDIERECEVNASDFPSSCDYSPYEGWKLKGWPEWTMVRGKIVMENGKVDEDLKWGKAIGVR
jgi:dihydroorotase-like cyclic amidohydrolase